MRIKKLELIGFKSFKDRTVIQFDEGITGIVGPNGCGKSNIVDALIWVMGEMSAKHLRGSSMEDVIFAGSEGYSPMGLAEVSLTLENDGGPFPIKYAKFSEIMVTRRLHRSGESEYLINKEPSRLRDVQEIFMDTGAGAKGFSIIEQGAIGKIITAKPEERRSLIEEAAGITKFKARKRESIRKLEATDQNLVRLQDIIGELKRQLSSLERQAKKAQRYRELRDQVKDLDLWLAARKFLDFKSQLESARSEWQRASEAVAGMQTELSTMELDVQKHRLELSQKEIEVNDCQRLHFEQQNNVLTKEKQLMELQFKIEQGRQNEKRSDSAAGELKLRRELLDQEVASLRAKVEALDLEHKNLSADYAEKSTALAHLEQSINELDEAISTKRREYLALQQSQTHMMAQSEIKIHKIEEMNRRLVDVTTLTEELGKKCTEFGGRRAKIGSQLESEKQMQLQIMNDVENFAQNISIVENEVQAKYKEVENFKDELNQVISRLYGLEDLHSNFEGFEEGVRTVMFWQRSRQEQAESQLGDTVGFQPVAEVVEVPSEFELAMEAALGSRLQYLLGNDHSQALEAVQYLKGESKGRSSFLASDLYNKGVLGVDKIPSGEGVAAILKDVVSAPDQYRNQVSILLDGFAIVDSISTALKLREMHPNWSFVTTDGDTLSADGVITGGAQQGADSGVLRRRREIKELRDRKEEWQGKLSLAQIALKKKEEQLKTLRSDYENAAKRSNEKEILLAELRKDFERAENELKNVEIAYKKQEDEKNSILSVLQEENEKLLQCQNAVKEIVEKTLALETGINQSIESLQSQKRDGEVQRTLATELKVKVAAREQELEGYRRQEGTANSNLDLTIEQLSRINEEFLNNSRELTENQHILEVEKVNLERMISDAKEFEGRYAKLKDEFEQISSQIRGVEMGFSARKSVVDEQSHIMNDMQLKIDQLGLQEKFLSDQVNDKYSVLLADRANEFAYREGNADEAESTLEDLKSKMAVLGEVNVSAIQEFDDLENRHTFLTKQHEDLINSKDQLRKVIDRINRVCSKRFKETFDTVNDKFSRVFPILFGGGEAKLVLIENPEEGEMGIDIVAKPPGKKMQNVTLMSGGEKALTAVALIFSIFLVKPSPYCLLDEVDAPLDDANVARFNDLVKEMAKRSQIIVVTHNKHTMAVNNKLYGVTMEEKGVSKMVSVSLAEAQKAVIA
ncbi:MAG: chromosome segregation protein SMC [Proteobacteria bacterium SG_bin7]|nr:MAG: chromosome segregation protein SMC [Proteobacteria bacterium SG_bin7]